MALIPKLTILAGLFTCINYGGFGLLSYMLKALLLMYGL
jgi:hypothetical protein